MKNYCMNVVRCIVCSPFRIKKMWWKTSVITAANRLNTLSRSRKIFLGVLIGLGMLYLIVPKLFGSHTYRYPIGSSCFEDKLLTYQKQIDYFDAVVSYNPPLTTQKNYPIYTGNGYIAAAFDTQSGLYIRLHRALSLPVKYYPVVSTNIEHASREELNVLQLRQGLANRIQVFNTRNGCVIVESQLYAHRSRPSLLMQEIHAHNPTDVDVYLDYDQVQSSGWNSVEQSAHSEVNHLGLTIKATITSGLVKLDETAAERFYVAVAIISTSIKEKREQLPAGRLSKQLLMTVVQYSKAMSLEEAQRQLPSLKDRCKQDMAAALKMDPIELKLKHTDLWEMLWMSGFSISYSRAADALNGDRINSTIYYVLSNVLAPLHDPGTSTEYQLELKKTLHYPDKCYNGHTALHSNTLWVDPVDEDSIARIVTTWIITLEKQGCQRMIAAGVEGVLQSMLLSIGSLQFGNDHLEMGLHPKDTHRDFNFHRINYGNNTHLNISVLVGEDNKANIFVSLDRNDKPYYACDAGCLDAPILLSKEKSKFPVKLTEPLTAILYITADKIHMEEYRHAIHVKEIAEAPAHEHHVIALHKHGHHFGGLPTIFWISIAFLVIVFHLFLFKLIYNEYFQAQEKFTKNRYHV